LYTLFFLLNKQGLDVILAKFTYTKFKTKRNGFAHSRSLQASSHVCQFTKSYGHCALTKCLNMHIFVLFSNGVFFFVWLGLHVKVLLLLITNCKLIKKNVDFTIKENFSKKDLFFKIHFKNLCWHIMTLQTPRGETTT